MGAELALFADAGIAWSQPRDFAIRGTCGALGGVFLQRESRENRPLVASNR